MGFRSSGFRSQAGFSTFVLPTIAERSINAFSLAEPIPHSDIRRRASFSALVVTVSYVGEIGMISSKRPDIMLYSTSMIFLCFHLFSKMKHVPKIIMFISNYSFSIYLLHAYFMIIGYVLLLNMPGIPAVPAVLLLFAVCTAGPILTSWALNKFKYGYLFVGKIYQPKQKKATLEVRDHAG